MDEIVDTPPTTVREVGIHIGYMRNDIRDIKELVSNLPTSFVSIKEHQETVDRVTAIEGVINSIKTRIVTVAISMLVLMILAQYGMDQFFRG